MSLDSYVDGDNGSGSFDRRLNVFNDGDNNVVIEADAPGYSAPSDFTVTLGNTSLKIEAKKNTSISKTIAGGFVAKVPTTEDTKDNFDVKDIAMTYEAGVLRIVLPIAKAKRAVVLEFSAQKTAE